MVDIANFLAQNSPRFNRSDMDRRRYGNALLKNEVDRLPQINRAQDLEIQAAEQTMGQNRTANARKMAADIFTAIAESPDPISTGAMLTQSQAFREVGGELKLPVDQFRPTQGDDPEQIRAAARSWAQAVGGGSAQQSVARTWVNPQTQTMWALDRAGRSFDTGVPAAQFAQRPVETGAGIESFDPARGATGGPISPAATAPALDAAAMNRKESEALGTGRGQAQAVFEASAPQRAEKRRIIVSTIDNVLAALDQASAGVNWATVGPGTLIRGFPGTPAYDLAQSILTVKANLGFDRLQQMRDASPTGGALGQVAVQELDALQASIASLDQGQSGTQIKANLDRVRQHYENWKRVVEQAGAQEGGMLNFSQMTDEQLQQIINGQ